MDRAEAWGAWGKLIRSKVTVVCGSAQAQLSYTLLPGTEFTLLGRSFGPSDVKRSPDRHSRMPSWWVGRLHSF